MLFKLIQTLCYSRWPGAKWHQNVLYIFLLLAFSEFWELRTISFRNIFLVVHMPKVVVIAKNLNDAEFHNYLGTLVETGLEIFGCHYRDVKMSTMASQITGVSIVCSTVCSDADRRKHQSSASLAFMRRIHRWSVNSPHKRPVTRKMFPFDDVIMFF